MKIVGRIVHVFAWLFQSFKQTLKEGARQEAERWSDMWRKRQYGYMVIFGALWGSWLYCVAVATWAVLT